MDRIKKSIIDIGLRCAKFRLTGGPQGGTFFITRKCNMNCSYCAVQKYRTEDINTETWFKIIDRVKDIGIMVVNIVGGEPLLREDIFEIIDYLNYKKICVILHSNFIKIDRTVIDKLAKLRLFALTASLDSFNGFEKSNISVYELLEHAKANGIIPIVSSVVTSKNIDELPEIARYTISKGIFYNLSFYQNIGGAFSNNDIELIPPKNKLMEIMDEIRRIKDGTGGIRSTYNFLKPHNLEYYYDK